MKIVLSIATACLLCMPAPAAELEGSWRGVWIKNGDAIHVTVDFAKSGNGYSGSFGSDDLEVAGIPFAAVDLSGSRVRWSLKGDATISTFEGSLTGRSLAGTFEEAGAKGRFELERSSVAPAVVTSRDITFENGGIKLAGTLLLPSSPGPHPAVLFLHGSGPEGRWANGWLARKFADAGVAALIYDKRGVGQSGGDWRTAGFEELAEDGVSGVRWLRTQPEIEPAKIGIYGHSQGGTIAPLVAAGDGRLSFVIASAAGGLPPAQVELFSVANALDVDTLPAAERADAQRYAAALVDTGYGHESRAALDSLARQFKSRSWYLEPPPASDPYWIVARKDARFHPNETWPKVKAPVLLLYGGHDARIPATQSAKAIGDALRSAGNTRVTVKFYADADHTFAIVDRAKAGGWPRHEPGYAQFVVGWARAH